MKRTRAPSLCGTALLERRTEASRTEGAYRPAADVRGYRRRRCFPECNDNIQYHAAQQLLRLKKVLNIRQSALIIPRISSISRAMFAGHFPGVIIMNDTDFGRA